jgi:acyl-coenzyme A synthetase/AMP-(fatty) acid ligase
MKKELTGYPSIDQTHKEGQTYFKRNPIIPNMNVNEAIKSLSIFYRKDLAIDCLDLTLSYDELINNAAIIAKAFKEMGIKAGDIITISMPNFYQAVATYLAANQIGAVTTFLNYYSSIDEIKRYLNLFESPLFIDYNQTEEYNQDIIKGTKVKNVITLGHGDLNSKTFAQKPESLIGYHTNVNFKDLEIISKYYHNPFNKFYGKKQDSLILFTSGTTGNPKSVVLTNENILSIGVYLKNTAGYSHHQNDKIMAGVPFTYPYGLITSTILPLLNDKCVILAPELSASNIGYYLSKNPNMVFGSPAMMDLIMKNVNDNQDLSSIKTFISGGDFMTESHAQAGIDFFKEHNAVVEISTGSGNAETTGGNTNAYGIKEKQNTVGKILVGSDAIIIDENGKELKYDEEGMLCITGNHVFKEYYKEPELTSTAKFIYNGKEYFKTGTMGKIDREGYFTLTGRASRFYIISTLNKIYCDHIQSIMSAIDSIESVAIVKKPNDDMLYTAKAYIVLKPGFFPDDDMRKSIIDKCMNPIIMPISGEEVQLKPYEIPNSIDFVDALPKTKADKVDYVKLEELAEKEYFKEKNNVKILKKQ